MVRPALVCVLAAISLAVATRADATDLTVNCDAGDSLQTTIWALDPVGPHHLAIVGTCHENVVIYQRDHLVLDGGGTAAIVAANSSRPALFINAVRGVEIYGLAIRGGRTGVVMTLASAYLSAVTVENNARVGIAVADGSFIRIDSSTVRNNGRSGMTVGDSSARIDGAVTVENNGASGIVGTASRVYLSDAFGPNAVRGNGGAGLSIGEASKADVIGGNTIESNNGSGVFVLHNSTITLNGAVVQNNGEMGISIQETSHAETSNLQIRNNGSAAPGAPAFNISDKGEVYFDGGIVISNNRGPGVVVTTGGLLSSVGGNAVESNNGDGVRVSRMGMIQYFAPADPTTPRDVITGNAGAALVCDTTSLVAGAVPPLEKVNCARIERDNGKPRPGHLSHLNEP